MLLSGHTKDTAEDGPVCANPGHFQVCLFASLKCLRLLLVNLKKILLLSSGDAHEYCLTESFQPRCTHGDVISMTIAQFGRMRIGRCISSDALKLVQVQPDALGCSANVLEYFDRICSGKSSCDVRVSNPDLYNYRPCSAELSSYLEAGYVCLPG